MHLSAFQTVPGGHAGGHHGAEQLVCWLPPDGGGQGHTGGHQGVEQFDGLELQDGGGQFHEGGFQGDEQFGQLLNIGTHLP